MQVVTTQSLPRMGRVMRKPQHSFQLRTRPWQVQPFLIAPVLPGETLKNLLMQARVVSDPVKNPLIGWWCEYYFFYVKIRDLDDRDTLLNMFMDPAWSSATAGMNSATAVTEHYFNGGTINWVDKCLTRVCDTYFRNEGETTSAFKIGALPAAKISIENWSDSAINAAAYVRPDLNVDRNANGTITASEVADALRQWEWLRANNLTTATYEDFLRSYGVRVPQSVREETHWPELVRYLREWTYPTNTVNPADGKPSSALSWSIAERADKDRFFREPGFLFGVTVQRPKVYLSNQKANASGMLNDTLSWLPAILRDDPTTSMKKFATGSGPLPSVSDVNGYWVDLKDLFVYGDQFVNFALTATDAGFVALPTATLQKRYADATMADALFVNAAGGFNLIRQDGVVNLNIAGAVVDQTATV